MVLPMRSEARRSGSASKMGIARRRGGVGVPQGGAGAPERIERQPDVLLAEGRSEAGRGELDRQDTTPLASRRSLATRRNAESG
jgi:hypothetical protein